MVRIDHAELCAFVSRLYVGLGATEGIAEDVSRSLVAADLSGHHSHGVRMTPTYAEWIEAGDLRPGQRPEVVGEAAVTATVDGRDAFGQVTGRRAVEVGATKAAEAGVATVGVRNGTHLGRIGEWAEAAADAGHLFVAMVCNPGSQYVAPPGSSEGRLSTNPIAMGIPSFDALEHPIVLDMATSQVAFNKVRDYAARGEAIPDGWTTGFDDETDAERFDETPGALMPLGGAVSGYKGFGLATMAELMAGILGDAPVSGQAGASPGNLAVFHQVDPRRFTTEEAIEERIEAFRRHVESAPREPGMGVGDAAAGDEWLFPGGSEHRARTEQLDRGVFVADGDAQRLLELAEERGVGMVPPDLEPR